MSAPLDLTKPADVADLFVATCKRLRELGATHVAGFGLSASFGPMPAPASEPKDTQPDEKVPPITDEGALELQARARRIVEGRT